MLVFIQASAHMRANTRAVESRSVIRAAWLDIDGRTRVGDPTNA